MITPSSASAETASTVTFNRIPNWTEYVGVAAFFALLIALSVKVVEAIRLGSWVWVAVAAVGGFIAADFISGLVHWLFDTWGSPETPVVGKTFIVPFRVHHSDPIDITRHGFVATNGHNCLATVPVLAGMLFLDMHSAWNAGALAFWMTTCLGTFGTNQFHKWAHQEEVGPVVAFLQKHHLVLNPRHHDTHHTRPYDQAYCITTGWMNPVLRAVRFFRVAEWAITKLTGVQPRKDDLTTA
ncbi:MAG TPA: fatty acid desaturase family protein [Myxococcaceae bacterium]|nr:fatty acid desaturase family protein [Myxococcaceae bacterium]